MTTNCRFASLVAFSQARALGLSSNAKGAATVAARGDAPAPEKDQITGSKKNEPGSAAIDLLHSDHPKYSESGSRAMYASLVAFHQSRDCGTGAGGFQKGNTCAGGVVSDVAKGAIKGAASGAIMAAGSLAPTPQYVAAGAGVGAAAGAVKGLYANRRRPTRVLKTIERIGSSEAKVSSLVKKLGGTSKSSADVSGKKLVLTVRNKDNKKSFTVEMDDNEIVVYPRQKADPLTSSEISRVQEIAKEASGKTVSVVVKSSSKSYTAKLVRKGFKVAANAAGELIASIVVPPAADVVIGDLAYAAKKARGR
jgi:hypothetical protein